MNSNRDRKADQRWITETQEGDEKVKNMADHGMSSHKRKRVLPETGVLLNSKPADMGCWRS